MNIYVVRHGEARPIGGMVANDGERPLSPRGEQDVRSIGQVLVRTEPEAPRIVCSPLLRARSTASLLGERYATPPVPEVWDDLAPGIRLKDIVSLLQKNGPGPIVLVGHQPDMTHLIAYLVADAAAEIAFPPGAMAALTLPQGTGAGAGRLHWLVTPELVGSLLTIND